MNTNIVRAFLALGLLLIIGEATAIPSFVRIVPAFAQALGNGKMFAGLVVEAQTGLQYLYVAGGFTLECGTSSLTQTAERGLPTYNPLGASLTVNVPEPTPGTYTIPNWSSIPAGTCGGVGQCVMTYRAEARDESTEFSVGIGGTGATFHLLPYGEIHDGNSRLINICRDGQPVCCTPGCSIP